jgi:hypothetical protein
MSLQMQIRVLVSTSCCHLATGRDACEDAQKIYEDMEDIDRLTRQDFGAVLGSEEKKNRRPSLNIFYGLALAEALLFLLEKAYWQWKIVAGKLLTEVNEEYGFDESELHTVRRFFYDAYSQCVNGSVFDGLKMDFVTYSVELVQSSGLESCHGELTGTRVLSALVNSDRFAEETLRAIGTMSDVVEKLIEMLNWKNHHEQEIRRAAAEIITKLVRKNRNCIRVGYENLALRLLGS